MNYVFLIGRLGNDPELKYTPSNTPVIMFSLAVDRKKKEDGTRETDWISCVAWNKTAELIAKYAEKGKKLGVIGSIQTRKYTTKEGENRTVTEVLVKEIELVERKPEQTKPAAQPEPEYFDPYEEETPF